MGEIAIILGLMLMAPLWALGLEYFYLALTGKRKKREDQDSGPWWF